MSQLTIQGGSGSNTVRGPDRDDTWQITGPNAGTLDGVVQFASVQNLVGGSGSDTFQFQNGGSLAARWTAAAQGPTPWICAAPPMCR